LNKSSFPLVGNRRALQRTEKNDSGQAGMTSKEGFGFLQDHLIWNLLFAI
jgi:hypothetical protein